MIRATALAYDDDRRGYSRRNEQEPHRILLVEDNKSDVFFIKRMLNRSAQGASMQFTDVPRMSDALELLDGGSFDLIILDLNLLDIDGIASVAAIHATAPHIPMLVISSVYEPGKKQGAALCGARSYLIKGRMSSQDFNWIIQNTLARP